MRKRTWSEESIFRRETERLSLNRRNRSKVVVDSSVLSQTLAVGIFGNHEDLLFFQVARGLRKVLLGLHFKNLSAFGRTGASFVRTEVVLGMLIMLLTFVQINILFPPILRRLWRRVPYVVGLNRRGRTSHRVKGCGSISLVFVGR